MVLSAFMIVSYILGKASILPVEWLGSDFVFIVIFTMLTLKTTAKQVNFFKVYLLYKDRH